MNKVCVFSVIFPAHLIYFDDFLTSLMQQDFKEFDIVLLNDGVQNLDQIIAKYKTLNFKVHEVKGTPAEIRQKGIDILINSTYENIIFCDTDDYFSNNRISVSLELLGRNDLVVNDVTLVTKDKKVITENYFSNALKNDFEFDYKFISDKNILGLSNTSINKKIISSIKIDNNITAVDWFIFTSLMVQKKAKGIFSNKAKTFYRQHADNTVGIGTVTETSILKAIRVKLIHYSNLVKLEGLFSELLDKFQTISNKLNDEKFRKDYLAYINSLNLKHPLWWEEAKEY